MVAAVLELLQVDLMSQTVDLVLVTRASYVDLTARFPESLLVEGYAFADVTDPTRDGLLLRFAGHWSDVLGAAKTLGVEESAFSVTNRHGSFIVKTSGAEGAVWYNGLRVY